MYIKKNDKLDRFLGFIYDCRGTDDQELKEDLECLNINLSRLNSELSLILQDVATAISNQPKESHWIREATKIRSKFQKTIEVSRFSSNTQKKY